MHIVGYISVRVCPAMHPNLQRFCENHDYICMVITIDNHSGTTLLVLLMQSV